MSSEENIPSIIELLAAIPQKINRRIGALGCEVFRNLESAENSHRAYIFVICEMTTNNTIEADYIGEIDAARDKYVNAIIAFNSHRESCEICKYLNEATYSGGTKDVLE